MSTTADHLGERRPPPSSPRRFKVAIRSASVLATVAALATLAAAALAVRPSEVAAQRDTDEPDLDADALARYRAFSSVPQERPVVLSYRDVRDNDDPADVSTVRPAEFARHLAMLAAAGFTTLGTDELIAHLHGAPVPARSVVITFDRGTKGQWIWADPLLERHGFEAIAFVITSAVGTHQPYYLNWPELEQMRDSGRWSIESHTHAGHERIPVDPRDPDDADLFVLSRAWLAAAGRHETIEEWDQRVRADLATSITTLTGHGFARPRLLSYPFTSVVSDTNDPAIPDRLEQLVTDTFTGALVNDAGAGPVRPRDVALRHLPRIEVLASSTTDALFERLTTHDRLDIAEHATPLAHPQHWRDREGSGNPTTRFAAGAVSVGAVPGRRAWLGLAPDQTSHWQDYTVAVTVSGLSPPTAGASGTIEVLSGSDQARRITVTGGSARVERIRTATNLLAQVTLPLAEDHRIETRVEPDRMVIRVDSKVIWHGDLARPDLDDASGGIALSAHRPDAAPAQVAIRDLLVTPNR